MHPPNTPTYSPPEDSNESQTPSHVRRSLRGGKRRGTAAIEYACLLSLLSVFVIMGVQSFGFATNGLFQRVSIAMGNTSGLGSGGSDKSGKNSENRSTENNNEWSSNNRRSNNDNRNRNSRESEHGNRRGGRGSRD